MFTSNLIRLILLFFTIPCPSVCMHAIYLLHHYNARRLYTCVVEVKDLISRCLSPKPASRPCLETILEHPWMKVRDADDEIVVAATASSSSSSNNTCHNIISSSNSSSSNSPSDQQPSLLLYSPASVSMASFNSISPLQATLSSLPYVELRTTVLHIADDDHHDYNQATATTPFNDRR